MLTTHPPPILQIFFHYSSLSLMVKQVRPVDSYVKFSRMNPLVLGHSGTSWQFFLSQMFFPIVHLNKQKRMNSPRWRLLLIIFQILSYFLFVCKYCKFSFFVLLFIIIFFLTKKSSRRCFYFYLYTHHSRSKLLYIFFFSF